MVLQQLFRVAFVWATGTFWFIYGVVLVPKKLPFAATTLAPRPKVALLAPLPFDSLGCSIIRFLGFYPVFFVCFELERFYPFT
jgi:hypothetical protein